MYNTYFTSQLPHPLAFSGRLYYTWTGELVPHSLLVLSCDVTVVECCVCAYSSALRCCPCQPPVFVMSPSLGRFSRHCGKAGGGAVASQGREELGFLLPRSRGHAGKTEPKTYLPARIVTASSFGCYCLLRR